MTIKIEINAHPDRGDMRDQIEQAMSALGFRRDVLVPAHDVNEAERRSREAFRDEMRAEVQAAASGDEHVPEKYSGFDPEDPLPVDDTTAAVVERMSEPEATEQPVRERGKPAPGRKRRTKEEIAEDEAADAAEPAEEPAAISTGEERVSPDDTPEDASEDAADEAAEAAASKSDAMTHDDLRLAAGRYRDAFGNQAMFAELPALIGGALVDVPADKIAEAVAKIDAAISKGAAPAPAAEEPATATKDDVIAAMMTYLKMADGPNAVPNDASTFPKSDEDFGKLFTMLFGAGITKLSHVPAKPDAYGKVLAGLQEMLEKDPFGRKS